MDAHDAGPSALMEFSGFSDLNGGLGNDEFEFSGATGTLTGAVDGGLGDDSIDLNPAGVAAVTISLNADGTGGNGRMGTAVGVIAMGFDRINAVAGRVIDTLLVNTPAGTTNDWRITALNTFTLDGSAIPFTGFGGLTGGLGPDIFTFDVGGRMAGGINGGNGCSGFCSLDVEFPYNANPAPDKTR